jgi:rhodanese-related sulfurtransferase
MKYLFIDIRKSDEVYSKHFDQSPEYSFYNIPMNMIRFNANTIIQHLEYVDEIYIVCQTTARSQFIKNKYFKQHKRIKVSDALQFSNLSHGSNMVSISLQHKPIFIHIVGSNSFNFYNVMRIIQTILGTVMLTIGIYMYIQLRSEKLKRFNFLPLVVLVLFGLMALYNGLTSTCSISTILEDYLN